MTNMSATRKRADSLSVSSGSVARDRPERLIHESKKGKVVGVTFVDCPEAISRPMVQSVADKACQLLTTFTDIHGEILRYRGQAGFLRGDKLSPTPEAAAAKRPKKGTVSFEHHASYECTPVTSRHNIASEDQEQYKNAEITFCSGISGFLTFQDGGCGISNRHLELRAASEDEDAVMWEANDWVAGNKIDDPQSSLTKKPLQFVQAPNDFELQAGQKIGICVYRTFDITNKDATAPSATPMEEIYGSKNRVCIYTGKVALISDNGETFEHDINTFKGCSGAVIFLLDTDQPESMDSAVFGMAVGIHVGGLTDSPCNVGFKLPWPSPAFACSLGSSSARQI